MKVYRSFRSFRFAHPVVVSIGKFASIHKGHELLLRQNVQLAKKKQALSLIIVVLSKNTEKDDSQKKIYKLGYCLRAYKLLGVNCVLLVFLDEIRELSYRDFLDSLAKKTNILALVASNKLRIGFRSKGTPEKIASHFRSFHPKIKLRWVRNQTCDLQEQKTGIDNYGKDNLSTTYLKALLEEGKVLNLAKLALLPFHIRGRVVFGKQEGAKIGYPTANTVYPSDFAPCKAGSYVSWTIVDKKIFQSVSFIGKTNIAKTKQKHPETTFVETYLFNLSGSLYNKVITVCLLDFIRTFHEIGDIKLLKSLIEADVHYAEAFFERHDEHNDLIKDYDGTSVPHHTSAKLDNHNTLDLFDCKRKLTKMGYIE